jgi:hypothetical protein
MFCCCFVVVSLLSSGNMLNFNQHLVELSLQETQLGNTGVTMVAQALHINSVSTLSCPVVHSTSLFIPFCHEAH